jgi:GT2 family glycosyltransferase
MGSGNPSMERSSAHVLPDARLTRSPAATLDACDGMRAKSVGPDDAPRLSVVVLSHARRELLRRTLASVFAQQGLEFEVVVVDNASSDGAPEVVRNEFPAARLLALEHNVGVRGRNLGFRAAAGEVIVSLDDDIELLDPETLWRVLGRFDARPELGALTLKICEDPRARAFAPEHWWHPVPRDAYQEREFSTDHLNEAAVAFRSEVLARAGYYYESLFWGGESWDLVLGIMDLGYQVRYAPEPCLHLAPRGNLNLRADPRHALLVRNRCWTALRRLPPHHALAFVLPRLALWGLRALRYGYLSHYGRGVGGLLRALPRIARERRQISGATRARLRELHARGTPEPLR